MYSYYTMSLLGWSCPWKKYLTQAQLVQFCVCLTHAMSCMVMGCYPTFLCLTNIWVMVTMLILFTRFYNSAYRRDNAKQQATNGAGQLASAGRTIKQQ